MSLTDGKTQWEIGIGDCNEEDNFEAEIVESFIAIHNRTNKHYYLIDVQTGQFSVHSFSIPDIIDSNVLVDRMIIWNNKEIQVVGFAPDLLRQ